MLSMPDHSYATALARVHDRIEAACSTSGRPTDSVRLLLAVKTQSASAIRAAVTCEIAAHSDRAILIGENRVQELVTKAPELSDLALTTHRIGPLQTNKINHALRALARHSGACIESIDSHACAAKVADRVRRQPDTPPLDVFLQVNVSQEASKAGVCPAEALDTAQSIAGLDGLRLRGFMAIAQASTNESAVRTSFARLRAIRDAVVASGNDAARHATELSMGMSRDLEWAIAEGATIVRIGSAVFGARTPA
jgi:PLP dependent protein